MEGQPSELTLKLKKEQNGSCKSVSATSKRVDAKNSRQTGFFSAILGLVLDPKLGRKKISAQSYEKKHIRCHDIVAILCSMSGLIAM